MIECRFAGGSRWFKGRIRSVVWTSGGNKYAVEYDDGDREDGVTKVILL